MGEAHRRAIAAILGEPDPLPQNVGVRPKPIPLPGKWLSSWATNRRGRAVSGLVREDWKAEWRERRASAALKAMDERAAKRASETDAAEVLP